MIRVRQIKCPVKNDDIKYYLSKKLKISKEEIIDYEIIKKSIDARDKNAIFFVYELDVNLKNEDIIKFNNDVFKSEKREYKFVKNGTIKLDKKIVIVGTGPCGLFAGLTLLENGYKVLFIERGEKIEERINSVENFFKTGILNENSNVQFGEGGAGTFSDGKLNTLVKDENNRIYYVLKTFYENGADKDIMYLSHPHIGTDVLRNVIINMRNKILSLGGEIKYNTTLTNIITENGAIKKIEVNNKDIIDTDVLVLAIGHSSFDTIKMLYNNTIKMSPKPFAVGLRCIHNQDMINESQYGKKYKDLLENSSYKLACQINGRGVYSFCMCPGGYVVNSSSIKNRLVVNGMSNQKRDSNFANSAIIVAVNPEDYGNELFSGMDFQKNLEQKAYEIGKGKIPVQLLKDFYDNKVSTTFKSINPIFMGDYTFANLNEIYPDYIKSSLKEAFAVFGKKIKGFDDSDTVLAGVESRTSSSIRIERDNNFESSIKGIYPAGEGAGFAGGITSAAIDGIKIAEKIGEKYI